MVLASNKEPRALEGKVALITGGLSGIGRAIASKFAVEGARVGLWDLATSSRDDGLGADKVAGTLATPALYTHCDVRKPDDVDSAFRRLRETLGPPDIVVNSAGVTVFTGLDELTDADFDLVMDVNVKGTFLVCQRAILDMEQYGRVGAIVNVASNFAFVAAEDTVVYSASKGAVVSMTKALALRGGPSGIRVNALCPGATATEFNRAYLEEHPDVKESWRAMTPLSIQGRTGFLATPEDMAAAALFLATDASAYMTGSSLVCDGGWNAA